MRTTRRPRRRFASTEHVFDFLTGFLDLRLRLIGLALRLKFPAADGFTGCFLRLPLGVLRSVAGLVSHFAHLESFRWVEPVRNPKGAVSRRTCRERFTLAVHWRVSRRSRPL